MQAMPGLFYFFKLSASVFDVSPIIGAVAFAVSEVDGGVVLLVVSLIVVSEPVEFSVPFPQDMKAPVITTSKNKFFIIDFFVTITYD